MNWVVVFSIACLASDVGEGAGLIPPVPHRIEVAGAKWTIEPTLTAQPVATDGTSETKLHGRQSKSIHEIQVSLQLPEDDLPPVATIQQASFAASGLIPHGLCYSICDPALGFCHRPLYFEHVWLERDGCSRCPFDSALAGAHFFGSVALLPYKVGASSRCQSTWGPRGWHRHQSVSRRQRLLGAINSGVVAGLFLLP